MIRQRIARLNDDLVVPKSRSSRPMGLDFPDGLPLPLHSDDMDLPAHVFEKYFRMSAKRLEDLHIDEIRKFKSLFKSLRKHGHDTPTQRFTIMLVTYGIRRAMMLRYPITGVSLELELIRRFVPDVDRFQFDRTRLRAYRWFVLCDDSASVMRLPGMLHYLMAIPPALEELNNWLQLTPQRQEDLALAIFALSSMLGNRIVIDVAVHQCPEIQKYYDTLIWDYDKQPGDSRYCAPTDLVNGHLSDTPDTIQDLLGRLSYFFNDFAGVSKMNISDLIQQISSLHDYTKSRAELIQQEYRAAALGCIDQLMNIATQDLGKFNGITGFTGLVSTQDYLGRLADMVRDADMDGLHQIDLAIDVFRVNYNQTLGRGSEAYERIRSAEDRLKELISAGAMQNAARIATVSADLQKMLDAFTCLFKPLTELEPPLLCARKPVTDIAVTPSPVSSDNHHALIADLTAEIEALRGDKVHLQTELSQKAAELYRFQCRPEKEQDNNTAQNRLQFLAELAVENGRYTPEGILKLIEAVYGGEIGGNRVVVLPSAYKSARDSSDFKHGARLYKLLRRLVSDYRDALSNGMPDSEARHILGNAYHANESETVEWSRELSRLRVFPYEGKEVAMFQHLAIGVADSTDITIRVHFHWDAERGRIAIGYCGPHLETIAAV